MNIKIKDNPNITLKNCSLYTEKKTAIYCANMFILNIKTYRESHKTSINNIGYNYEGFIYNVKLTKTGNIIVVCQN